MLERSKARWAAAKPAVLARWRSARPCVLAIGSVLLVILTIRGLKILSELLAKPWSIVVWAAAFALLLLRLAAHVVTSRPLDVASRWVIGIPVPVLTLVAVDAAWADVINWRPPPVAGLVLAGLVIGFSVWVYLETWWTPDQSKSPVFWAAFFVWWLVIAPPMLAWSFDQIGSYKKPIFWAFGVVVVGMAAITFRRLARRRSGRSRSKRWRLAWAGGLATVVAVAFAWTWSVVHEDAFPPQRAVSSLDVITISGGPGVVTRPAVSHGWDLAYWSGRTTGANDAVDWGADGAPPAGGRRGADRVLVLLPDGAPSLNHAAELPNLAPHDGEVDRWLAIADRVAPPSVPTYVVLQTRDKARRRQWCERLKTADRGCWRPRTADTAAERHGGIVSLQEEQGDVGSLAFRLASTSPTVDQDLAIAALFRPALFFASGERYTTPLNVDRLLESGVMKICPDNQPGLGFCSDVHSSADLHNANNHLSFKTDEVAAATKESTIYVHVPPDRVRGYVYLDYWWYLPDNPANAGDGALCGAGFVIAEITCHDHQSDWEGVTVVGKLGSGAQPPEPVAVHYSAHNGRTRYEWKTLNEIWKGLEDERGRPFEPGVDTSTHPLVFVALGTHASYPHICRREHCDEGSPLNDKRHDGKRRWFGNDDADPRCTPGCLAALPTAGGGTRPARWNAYDGVWGRARCELWIFCNQTDGPQSPGQQKRYEEPWCATHWAEWTGRKARVSKGRRCYPAPSRKPSARRGTAGRTG